jgi:hypothetical protein
VNTSLRIFLSLNHEKNFSLERDSQALNKSQQEAFSSTFRAKAKFFKPRVSYDSCNDFFFGYRGDTKLYLFCIKQQTKLNNKKDLTLNS